MVALAPGRAAINVSLQSGGDHSLGVGSPVHGGTPEVPILQSMPQRHPLLPQGNGKEAELLTSHPALMHILLILKQAAVRKVA